MNTVAVRSDEPARRAFQPRWGAVAFWTGLALLAIPTLLANAHQSWSTEQGEQAPIVLAIGLWLIAQQWPRMRAVAQPGSRTWAVRLGVAAALLYVVGRVSDQFLLESYGLYALAMVGLYALVGRRAMQGSWFPLAYLLFALPPPYTITWMLTSHLRLWITEAAVATYQVFGLSIVRDGLNIFVDQYELAVKEACSGMNSLVSLSAIGFVYLYLRRSPPLWYLAVMTAPIVGFAVLGNFVRVLILIALTHFFGDAVAQGFLHETAGLATFIVALAGVIIVDALAAPLVLSTRRAKEAA